MDHLFYTYIQVSLFSREGVLLGTIADVDSLVWCVQSRPGQNHLVCLSLVATYLSFMKYAFYLCISFCCVGNWM